MTGSWMITWLTLTYRVALGAYTAMWGERSLGGLGVKINAPLLLERELSRLASRGGYGFIALGTATEPWMGVEEEYRVTRGVLGVIGRYRFPRPLPDQVHSHTEGPGHYMGYWGERYSPRRPFMARPGHDGHGFPDNA